jgi:ferrochelatase
LKKGILLSNLGSPDAPTPEALKVYLDQFLMDPYVIDVPYLLRVLLIRGIVLRKRPAESAKAYSTIWNIADKVDDKNTGSPLVTYTRRHTLMVQKILGENYSVKFAMRYGKPSIKSVLDEFLSEGIREVSLLPLYPQWALASTGSTLAHIKKLKHPCKITQTLKNFYDDPDFIDLIFKRARATTRRFSTELKTHYLFSFHGLPERHIKKSPGCANCPIDDTCCLQENAPALCYRSNCYKTAHAVAKKLELAPNDFTISFQSRLGPDKWLQPPTDLMYKELAERGVARLVIFSPAFVADCLETLEELNDRGRNDFFKAGGREFYLVPSLNDGSDWAELVAKWIGESSNFEDFVGL